MAGAEGGAGAVPRLRFTPVSLAVRAGRATGPYRTRQRFMPNVRPGASRSYRTRHRVTPNVSPGHAGGTAGPRRSPSRVLGVSGDENVPPPASGEGGSPATCITVRRPAAVVTPSGLRQHALVSAAGRNCERPPRDPRYLASRRPFRTTSSRFKPPVPVAVSRQPVSAAAASRSCQVQPSSPANRVNNVAPSGPRAPPASGSQPDHRRRQNR